MGDLLEQLEHQAERHDSPIARRLMREAAVEIRALRRDNKTLRSLLRQIDNAVDDIKVTIEIAND